MFIVDVEGFKNGCGYFLCKEITILNTKYGNYQHAEIKMPIDLKLCNYKFVNQCKWLTNNLHKF